MPESDDTDRAHNDSSTSLSVDTTTESDEGENLQPTDTDSINSGDRMWHWARRLFVANLVLQIAIVVTGGLVRLTASGLGCSTWPKCVPESYVPVADQEQGYHKFIEFGNRSFGLIVGVVALGVAVWGWRLVHHRLVVSGVQYITALPLILVVAQVVLGGITVLTQLSPQIVSLHFLLSMILIVVSTWIVCTVKPSHLRQAPEEPGNTDPDPNSSIKITAPNATHAGTHHWPTTDHDPAFKPGYQPSTALLRGLAYSTVVVLGLVLIVGTLVTGSGPHSGDTDASSRYGFDPQMISWVHADLVMLFIGLLMGLLIASRIENTNQALIRRTRVLAGLAVVQALIGYAQYSLALPISLVLTHMLMASLLTASATTVIVSLMPPLPAAAEATPQAEPLHQ